MWKDEHEWYLVSPGLVSQRINSLTPRLGTAQRCAPSVLHQCVFLGFHLCGGNGKKSGLTKSLFSSLAQMLNTRCLLHFFRKLLLDALS